MEVFVFDLDFTLWNAGDTWCSETNPPYVWQEGKLHDQSGRWIRLYPETLEVLNFLKSRNKLTAIASRTHQPEWAKKLLQIFNLESFFILKEIYPGSKVLHLTKIKEQINFPADKIVFFDDEERNIQEVSALDILSVKVNDGINLDMISQFVRD